jgi:hypothetical protein
VVRNAEGERRNFAQQRVAALGVPACATLQLPNASWLTFRRTYASWAHAKGVPGALDDFRNWVIRQGAHLGPSSLDVAPLKNVPAA